MKKVNLLSKAEMRKVLGGVMALEQCNVTNTNSNGATVIDTYSYETSGYSGWTCDQMKSDIKAKGEATHATNGGTTHYDCGCDGWNV